MTQTTRYPRGWWRGQPRALFGNWVRVTDRFVWIEQDDWDLERMRAVARRESRQGDPAAERILGLIPRNEDPQLGEPEQEFL